MRTTKASGRESQGESRSGSWLARTEFPARRGFIRGPKTAAPKRLGRPLQPAELRTLVSRAAIAFRGYDATNIGRSAELLAHPVYGPIITPVLEEASELCRPILGRSVALADRIRAGAESTLDSFVEDIATIVGLELAQMKILEQVFDVPVKNARMSFGHSIGELAALVLGGVYTMEQLLPVPLSLAPDCAALTPDTMIGIVSANHSTLDITRIERLCRSISGRGHGLVGPSTYLSPDHILLIGQQGTLDEFEREMHAFLGEDVALKRRPNHFPPLHTPLVWEKNIPNRTAMAMHHIIGGNVKPTPPIVSGCTGIANYDEWNSRVVLADWTDHPQRLWDVVETTLHADVELVIHAGPAPKLFSSTFERLSHRVVKQLRRSHLERLSSSVIPSISRQRWLLRSLPDSAVLLRAPYLGHMILEDWLLAQDVA